jgi:anti-anti-sigma regulatory factor
MWRPPRSREYVGSYKTFESLSRICRLVISAEGILEVVLLGPTIRYEDFQIVCERVGSARVGSALRMVVFDFSQVETLESPWTTTLAFLIVLARSAGLTCRARSLHGQPASVISLFRHNDDVRSIFAPEAPIPMLSVRCA